MAELLVVLGVVAVLVGLALPSIAKSRQQATRVVAGSAMQQVGMLLATYVAENRDTYPIRKLDMTPDKMGWQYVNLFAELGLVKREQIGTSNSYKGIAENIQMSMALVYKHELMRPGHTEPEAMRRVHPVTSSQVVYPSDKGALWSIRDESQGNHPLAYFCCVSTNLALPISFVDGSVRLQTWQDSLAGGVFYTDAFGIGSPVSSTWFGVQGRDRR
jgi:type II secretory pathway pseudopilin PulG